jgi:hypothetical protein
MSESPSPPPPLISDLLREMITRIRVRATLAGPDAAPSDGATPRDHRLRRERNAAQSIKIPASGRALSVSYAIVVHAHPRLAADTLMRRIVVSVLQYEAPPTADELRVLGAEFGFLGDISTWAVSLGPTPDGGCDAEITQPLTEKP